MADEERSILLKVELDVGQLRKQAEVAEEKLAALVPKLADLKKENKQNTIEYKEIQLEIRKYNKELTDSVKAIQTAEKSQTDNSGSIKEMREQLSAAKLAYASLSQEVRDSDIGEKQRDQIVT